MSATAGLIPHAPAWLQAKSSNPELDDLLGLPPLKPEGDDPNRMPRFPRFHDLLVFEIFADEQEVETYRQSFRGPPITPDAKNSDMDNLLDGGEIYDAIVETRYSRDYDSRRPANRNMPANGHYYDPKMIVAISCLLANKLTIGSITGFMQSNEEGQEPSIENIYPLQRHRELCLVLLFEKSIAEEVLRGDEQKIANLLAGPAAYALNKPEVRDSWVAGILEASRAAGNSPNPVLPPPRRNASIPAYPNFDQILLSEPRDVQLDQELLYLETSRFPPIPGEPVSWLKTNKRYLVAMLYDAIRCVSEIRRREDGINGAHFIADTGPRLSPSVDHRTLQEACWRIATAFLDGVKHGFVKPKMPNRRDERPIKPGSETITWDHRFTLMLKALRSKKALCWRLVKSSRGLDYFLADPYGFRKLGVSDADPAAAVPHA